MPTMWGTLAPVAVPEEISRRQFFQVLANRELITREEALVAATTGVLPAAIETLLAGIADEDVEWSARMSFTAQTFKRSNWCVEFFGAMMGMSSVAVDQLWKDGSLLD